MSAINYQRTLTVTLRDNIVRSNLEMIRELMSKFLNYFIKWYLGNMPYQKI